MLYIYYTFLMLWSDVDTLNYNYILVLSPWRCQDYWSKHGGERIINKKYIIKLKCICRLFVLSTNRVSYLETEFVLSTNRVRYLETEFVHHTYDLWAFISYVALSKCILFMLMVRIVTTMFYGDKFNVDFVLCWLSWPFTFGTLLVAFRSSQFSCWYSYCHELRTAGDITTLLVASPRMCLLTHLGRGHLNCLNSRSRCFFNNFNPLNAELNPICYLLALLGAHHFLHVSRIRVK